MIVQSWVDVLQQSFATMLASVVAFLPSLVFAVIIFVVGWFIGSLLGRIIAQAVRSLKVDQALRSAGVGDIVSRAGYSLDSGAFLGALVKWFVIIVFLLWALQVLALHVLPVQVEPFQSPPDHVEALAVRSAIFLSRMACRRCPFRRKG